MDIFKLTAESAAHSRQHALVWLIDHCIPFADLFWLVEVGVYTGETAEALLAWLPMMCYVGIDTWLPRGEDPLCGGKIWAYQRARQVIAPYYPRARLIARNSVDAARDFAPGTMDLVFIDAGHDHEAVTADLAAWQAIVKPGGVLCGHDYRYIPEVGQAVDEFFGQAPEYIGGEADVWWVVKEGRGC